MTVPGDVLVQSCLVEDYDTVTHVCSAPFYTFPASPFPQLSLQDAQAIGLQIALLWAVAWCFRALRKALQEIG